MILLDQWIDPANTRAVVHLEPAQIASHFRGLKQLLSGCQRAFVPHGYEALPAGILGPVTLRLANIQ